MNPFVLNKMHGAFVPDRLTDVAATTPAVNPEPTVQHMQITPIVDTEHYRHLRQNMGLPTKPTTESHALRISDLSDHMHPSGVGINRATMAVNYVKYQRIKQRVDVGELVVRHSLRTMDLALPNVYKSTK